MSSSSRRQILAAALAVVGLSACGFTPAYGPQGGAQGLQSAIAIAAPVTRADYLLVRRLEERLGRPAAVRLSLAYDTTLRTESLGTTEDGRTTRVQLVGTTTITITRPNQEEPLHTSTVSAFTGYSPTGTTVSTLAAERDGEERLMVILADKIVDRLLLLSPTLLAADAPVDPQI